MDLVGLIAAVHVKNELNRARRRCWVRAIKSVHLHDVGFYRKRYNHFKKEMKGMTKGMSLVRKELGVVFVWNDGGMISRIKFKDNRASIHYKNFKKYYDLSLVDNIILGESNEN